MKKPVSIIVNTKPDKKSRISTALRFEMPQDHMWQPENNNMAVDDCIRKVSIRKVSQQSSEDEQHVEQVALCEGVQHKYKLLNFIQNAHKNKAAINRSLLTQFLTSRKTAFY